MNLKPIKTNSQFMKLNNDTSIERLNSLVGKDVYVDISQGDGICSYYYKLAGIQNDKVLFGENDFIIDYYLDNIKAIEEIKNYNDKTIDFKGLINKSVMLTDMHNNTENVVIKDYDDKNVYLFFIFENNDGKIWETDDYEFPICFIKNIEEA